MGNGVELEMWTSVKVVDVDVLSTVHFSSMISIWRVKSQVTVSKHDLIKLGKFAGTNRFSSPASDGYGIVRLQILNFYKTSRSMPS